MTHNQGAAAGEHTFTLGLNRFADLTVAEFEATYLSPKEPNPLLGSQYQCPEQYTSSMSSSDLPTSWDWRDPSLNDAGVNGVVEKMILKCYEKQIFCPVIRAVFGDQWPARRGHFGRLGRVREGRRSARGLKFRGFLRFLAF